MEENKAVEQFFWTCETVDKLMEACKYIFVNETCCLTTPSIAHKIYECGRDEILLDIDKRFSYLPKFQYYDVRYPVEVNGNHRLLIIDPPSVRSEICD